MAVLKNKIPELDLLYLYRIWKDLVSEHPHRFKIVWHDTPSGSTPELHSKNSDGYSLIMKLPPSN